MEQALRDGWEAGRNGKVSTDNPHEQFSKLWYQWNRGWLNCHILHFDPSLGA